MKTNKKNSKNYSDETINLINKIKTGQTQIDGALSFAENPTHLAEVFRHEKLMPQVDFLKFIIKNKLNSNLFEPELMDFLDVKIRNNFTFTKFSSLIKLLKREYKDPKDFDHKVDKLFNDHIGDFEMMVEFCFKHNNPNALDTLLKVRDYPHSPLLHIFCESFGNVNHNKVEEFYKVLVNHGRDILDIPSRKNQLCFFDAPNEDESGKEIENIFILLRLIEQKHFKNEGFLKEMEKLRKNLFPWHDNETITGSWLYLLNTFDAILEKRKIGTIVNNQQIHKSIL